MRSSFCFVMFLFLSGAVWVTASAGKSGVCERASAGEGDGSAEVRALTPARPIEVDPETRRALQATPRCACRQLLSAERIPAGGGCQRVIRHPTAPRSFSRTEQALARRCVEPRRHGGRTP